MGFIAAQETQILSKKASYDPVAPEEEPTVGEIAGAVFRQENIVGSFFTRTEGLPDITKDNLDYDPYSLFTEDEKSDETFVSHAMFADNNAELEAVRKQISKERTDRSIMAKGGATSFVVGMPVMIADPISLLTIGGAAVNTYRAGRGILKSAAVTGSLVGVESAVQEAALHSQQLTRTYGESAINISAGTLLGGILGGTVANLSKYGIDEKVIKEMADVMEVEPKIAENINPAINAKTPLVGEDSVGAARVIGNVEVTGKVAKFLTKYLGFDPLSRTITRENPITRRVVSELAENPIMMDGFTGQAVESLAKIKSGKLASSIDNNNRLYAQYKKEKGTLTRRDFNVAVASAIRTGDSEIPQIKESADFWRNEFYNPLKDEMIELKMLPEDVDIKTATNYLNRVWNKNKISTNYPQFVGKVSDWLEKKDANLFAKAKEASSRIGKAEGKEKADLQKIIDKAEFKEGMQFERQDYESIAKQIAQRIVGSPDGRLPYDWKIGTGSSSGISGTALRGPLRNRVFQIDDDIIEEFLENDIEILGSRYLQNTAGDIELTRKFDDVTMTAQIKEVGEWYQDKMLLAKTEKESAKLQAQWDADVRDIAGMRDRIRGVYGFGADNVWTRIARSSRDLNYLRLLGGVTVSSLPDIARVVMAEGFAKTFSKGLIPLASNLKTFKVAANEARRYGVGTDALMSGKAEIIADVGDYTQGGTMLERGLRSATSKFGKVNFLDHWTAGIKQLHAVTMQTSIFDGLSKGKFDKRLERLGIDEQSAKDMWKQVQKHGRKQDGVWITNAKNWDRPDLEQMWGVALRKESDRVIVIPGQEKPLFMSSELGKTIGQFRSFILSATQRVLIAGLQNQDHNALGGFVSLVGMGTFTYFLKQKIAGREVSDDIPTLLAEGIDRSGVLGSLGEINNTLEKISGNSLGLRPLTRISAYASKQVSRTVSESILGPTLGSLLSTTIAASNSITSKEPMTESDVRTLRRLIPLQNLFYTRWAFDKAEKAVSDL